MPNTRDEYIAVRVPHSDRAFLPSQLQDLFNAPDWHPKIHPTMPDVVARGRKPDVYACGYCHLPDGATPDGTLLARTASVRVGVTTTGGTGICSNVGCGTVYRLAQTADGWVERVIYQFKGGADGSIPVDRLIADANGSLYGATAEGGLPGPDGHFATGTVFRLDPPSATAARWTKTILYEFQGGEDGYSPQGGVTLDEHGALYGTTEFGGALFAGTVFKLTPNAPGQPWTKTILHNFGGGAGDGADPSGRVTLDTSGTIFGTTLWGGSANYGTVYRIAQQSSVSEEQ